MEKRTSEIDHSQTFSGSLAVDALMAETYEKADAAVSEQAVNSGGRLNGPLLIKNAKVLLAAGDTKLAKQIFRSLIEQGEMLGVAYAGLGAAFELENKADLAIKSYREAIIYEPTYGALLALAELYLQKEDFSAAVGTLLRAKNLSRLSAAQLFCIHKALGNCYLHVNQTINAEAHYRKAYEIQPQSDILHTNIGSLALKKNDVATAILHFKEALRLQPNNAQAHSGIGMALMSEGKKQEAIASFAAALSNDGRDAASLANIIRCAYETKTFPVAIEKIQTYILNNPMHPNLLFCLAGMLYHEQKYSLAKKECERLLSIQPEHAGAKKLLGLMEAKNGG